MPRICTDFLLRREQTCSAIWTSQNFDSIKWPTVLVRDIKGKPCNFEGCLCASFYYNAFQRPTRPIHRVIVFLKRASRLCPCLYPQG